eukprot:2072298-Prymnesium_polylepis.1
MLPFARRVSLLALLQLAGGSYFTSFSRSSSVKHSARRPVARASIATLQEQSAARDPYDWRRFRAQMIRESRGPSEDGDDGDGDGDQPEWWVHELVAPEPGCVLLAQPHALFPDQPHLHRGVVLVVQHDATHGTIGLLLSCAANRTVGDLLSRRKQLADQLAPFVRRP